MGPLVTVRAWSPSGRQELSYWSKPWYGGKYQALAQLLFPGELLLAVRALQRAPKLFLLLTVNQQSHPEKGSDELTIPPNPTALNKLYFFKINLFIYFWLRWVFIAIHGPPLVVASGGHSSLWCAGLSLRWLLLLRSTGSRHAGFRSCGTRAQ